MRSRPLRLLVIEGNTAETRDKQRQRGEKPYGESYADILRELALEAVTDICYPTDAGANVPDSGGLSGYDGVTITGSALNIYKGEPESLRQVELARAVFEAGVPFFGSCWGLQVATVAAGGAVSRSGSGREIGLARKISLSAAGLGHGLHAGKGPSYDAVSIHTDEVTTLPDGMTVTASNAYATVQAAEIRYGKGVFWGVQYHPEFTLLDIARIMERYTDTLIGEGHFQTGEDAARHVADLRALGQDPARTDIAWRLGIDGDVLDPKRRLREIANWIEHEVSGHG